MLDLRRALAAAVGVDEEKLPFVGELLDVRSEEQEWQGAIERVLRGFALSLLVDDKYYPAVSVHLNNVHLGERLAYLRMTPQPGARRSLAPSSLVHKLAIAPGQCSSWLREELCQRFEYECVESIGAFRNAQRAITRQGQVKHNTSRHEKDDRFRADDRTRWVLGFDNKRKLGLYKDRALELARVQQESHSEALKAANAVAEPIAIGDFCQPAVGMAG